MLVHQPPPYPSPAFLLNHDPSPLTPAACSCILSSSTQVSDTMISIATLTGESLDQMNSIANAPKILATLVGKGGDFRNGHGPDGVPVMPQVRGRVQGLPFAVVLWKILHSGNCPGWNEPQTTRWLDSKHCTADAVCFN